MISRSLLSVFLICLVSTTSHASSLSITTNRVLDIETFIINNSDIAKWSSTALKFFDFLRCTEANLASPDECSQLGQISRSNVNIYIGYDRGTLMKSDTENNAQTPPFIFTYSLEKARVSPNLLLSKRLQHDGERREKVYAVLPDTKNMKASGEHDVVLVLDPYAGYNFGHLLGLFYVDMDVESGKCEEKHQIQMADRTCITVARKPRCPNVAEENAIRYHQPSKCYIDFLPTVHRSSDFGMKVTATMNLLECLNLNGFAACPKLRQVSPVDSNEETSGVPEIRTRCKLFQRCDRGILIGGGWNQLHLTLTSENNIRKMESMLRSNGFLTENVKVFYGNGGESKSDGVDKSQFHSLELKSELRGHLRKICESKHCADTLFIYLNSPTTVGGDFLFWDLDNNGIADDQEFYGMEEFVSDISNCQAQRLIIVTDQSRTDTLVSFLRKSNAHSNVVIFTSGLSDQRTRNGELTSLWANHSHPMGCLKHIQQATNLWMKDSTSVVFDATGGAVLNLSVSGAPCGDLYSRELRPLYQGCQNLPTSIWFSLNYGEVGDSSEDEDEEVAVDGNGKQSRDTSNDSNASYSRRLV